jgi:hypothetical protein
VGLEVSQSYGPPGSYSDSFIFYLQVKNSEVIPVTGSGHLQGFEILRIPHLLHNLADGGEVVSLTHQPSSTPQKLYLSLAMISVRGE